MFSIYDRSCFSLFCRNLEIFIKEKLFILLKKKKKKKKKKTVFKEEEMFLFHLIVALFSFSFFL